MVNSRLVDVPSRALWREAKRGKSVGRILTNHVLAQWRNEIKGVVLDLACGNHPSYRRILRLEENAEIRVLGVDYNIAYHPRL